MSFPEDAKESKEEHVDILIVGAGPTGLGAATRIAQLKRQSRECASLDKEPSSLVRAENAPPDLQGLSYMMVDAGSAAGGLASTACTPQNFLFDLGGHVIFSHYQYFDQLVQHCRGTFASATDWAIHRRESYVYLEGQFVEYPFQFHFGSLSSDKIRMDCLLGLARNDPHIRLGAPGEKAGKSFAQLVKDLLEQKGRGKPTSPTIAAGACNGNGSQPNHNGDHNSSIRPRRPQDFEEWIVATMGHGIYDHFMGPYNFKIWAYPPSQMSWTWLGERVAPVNLEKALEHCASSIRLQEASKGPHSPHARGGKVHQARPNPSNTNEKTKGWGPNSTFAFPQQGGTGSIWNAVAEKAVPKECQRYGMKMTAVDMENRTVHFQNGTRIRYEYLVNTSPLDETLRLVGRNDLADRLHYCSTHIVGLGIRGTHPHDNKCWLYYPGDNCPFYRVTIFSNYAKGNCPGAHVQLPTLYTAASYISRKTTQSSEESGQEYSVPSKSSAAAFPSNAPGPYHSLMFEISSSQRHKPIDEEAILADTLQGAIHVGLLKEDAEIVSDFYRRLERGYPVPHLDRDTVLEEAIPWLEDRGNILNRGRFGSWKYEVANQDHSVMLGVEAIDRLLLGKEEVSFPSPNVINGNKGTKQADRTFGY